MQWHLNFNSSEQQVHLDVQFTLTNRNTARTLPGLTRICAETGNNVKLLEKAV